MGGGGVVGNDGAVAPSENVIARLYAALDDVPPEKIMPVIGSALGEAIDALRVGLLLADYAEATLERFDHDQQGSASDVGSISIESSVAGSCYRRQEVVAEASDEQEIWSVFAPVTVRSERFGVLEIELGAAPGPEVSTVAAQVACALAYVLTSAQRYTDLFERVRRRRNLALAAEMQWELLPMLGYDAAEFRLAGSLEPAYDVGGDNFDYAVDGTRLTLSISDAMGHGLGAALCSTLAVVALRNCRRAGQGIVEQARVTNQVLGEQFAGDMYVTTLLVEIDLATGRGAAVNAGHPPPWRHGATSVGPVRLAPDRPLGMFPDSEYRSQPVALDRGDRLVLLTDGILEAGPNRNDTLGIDRFASLVAQHRAAPPNQFVRQVTRAVLAHRGDELLDDATLLCLDWTGAGA